MTHDEIEKMKSDIESGTPGFWTVTNGYIHQDGKGEYLVHVAKILSNTNFDAANARRIARVPQLEAEVLRLRRLLAEKGGRIMKVPFIVSAIILTAWTLAAIHIGIGIGEFAIVVEDMLAEYLD